MTIAPLRFFKDPSIHNAGYTPFVSTVSGFVRFCRGVSRCFSSKLDVKVHELAMKNFSNRDEYAKEQEGHHIKNGLKDMGRGFVEMLPFLGNVAVWLFDQSRGDNNNVLDPWESDEVAPDEGISAFTEKTTDSEPPQTKKNEPTDLIIAWYTETLEGTDKFWIKESDLEFHNLLKEFCDPPNERMSLEMLKSKFDKLPSLDPGSEYDKARNYRSALVSILNEK